MSNRKLNFNIIFKNVPYTDEEFERFEAQKRDSLRDYPKMSASWRASCQPSKHRPNHPTVWHRGIVRSHEEAKAICEKGIAQLGAQRAEYFCGEINVHKVCNNKLVWSVGKKEKY